MPAPSSQRTEFRPWYVAACTQVQRVCPLCICRSGAAVFLGSAVFEALLGRAGMHAVGASLWPVGSLHRKKQCWCAPCLGAGRLS